MSSAPFYTEQFLLSEVTEREQGGRIMLPSPCILRTDDNLPTQPLRKCGVTVQIRLISAGPASKSVLSAYHVPVLEREL